MLVGFASRMEAYYLTGIIFFQSVWMYILQADNFRISIPDENNFHKAASGKSGIMTTRKPARKVYQSQSSDSHIHSLAVRLHGA